MSVTADTGERSRIIDAAYQCLVDTDGGGLSVTGVLTAAGLSTRAFYRHFDSKDALLLAMFRRASDRVHAELTAAAAAASTPPEALRAWICGFLSLTADRHRRRVLAMSCGELMGTAGYAAERARMTGAHHAAIALILERGRADGSLPWADPDADARTITAALSAAFQERMAQGARDDAAAARAAEQVTDFAFRALGAASA